MLCFDHFFTLRTPLCHPLPFIVIPAQAGIYTLFDKDAAIQVRHDAWKVVQLRLRFHAK